MPLKTMFGRFGHQGDRVDQLIASYREFQIAHHDVLVQPYARVDETLTRLHTSGYRLGVVTSKFEPMARRGLDLFGLTERFDTIVGVESCVNHKPHPEPVETALRRLGVAPADAVFIGDSPHDMAAGRAAGTRTAAALWGPFTREQIAPTAPDWWLTAIDDLLPLLGLER